MSDGELEHIFERNLQNQQFQAAIAMLIRWILTNNLRKSHWCLALGET